ncbi:MAG: hypothetical protein PF542_00920 [Nanoarchaeota archaeon]|jgi:hypothetical protein|nr:hypothetical protein [Nanoarchaeota archaeon]
MSVEKKDWAERNLSKIMGGVIGVSVYLAGIAFVDQEVPDIRIHKNTLDSKVWNIDNAIYSVNRGDAYYLVSALELKKDSLELERNELINSFEYRQYKNEKNKKDINYFLGLAGFLGLGIGSGYSFEKKRNKNKKV